MILWVMLVPSMIVLMFRWVIEVLILLPVTQIERRIVLEIYPLVIAMYLSLFLLFIISARNKNVGMNRLIEWWTLLSLLTTIVLFYILMITAFSTQEIFSGEFIIGLYLVMSLVTVFIFCRFIMKKLM